LESQHVALLTEGYLRGWLNFDYALPTSFFRELVILEHIKEERLYSLLQNKLFIETILRSTLSDKSAKGIFDPIYETSSNMIGLKLPSLRPTDTIENSSKNSAVGKSGLSKQEIEEYKAILIAANKKLAEQNSKKNNK
jgi:hypothetical protein